MTSYALHVGGDTQLQRTFNTYSEKAFNTTIKHTAAHWRQRPAEEALWPAPDPITCQPGPPTTRPPGPPHRHTCAHPVT